MNAARGRITLLGAIACMTLAAKATGQESAVRTIRDIAYSADASTAYQKERCKLDLYLPREEGASGFATIVWFHGGGLQGGDKTSDTAVRIAERFAGEGIAVAAVNYRLHPKVTFPVYIEDAAASFAWIRRNIERFGGDPDRIFVSGHSAGGYLTAMIGLDPRYLGEHGLALDTIAGLIPVSGQMVTHSTVRGERGISGTTPVIDAAAPSYYARKETPPILSVCGGEDLPARAAENIYFVAAMKAAGNEHVEYLEVAGRNHGTIASRIPEAEDEVARAFLSFVRRQTATPAATAPAKHVGHRILAADSSKRRIAMIDREGRVEWEYEIGPLHDLHRLPGGNILFQKDWTHIVEVDPKTNEIVWQYDSARRNGNEGQRVEVHAFQRLPDGLTMIAESGRSRIIEVDRDGTIVREVRLKVPRPDPHRDTRLVRKLDTGNYLVSHEGMGMIREYNAQCEVVWEYPVPLFGKKPKGGHGPEAFGNASFCALRLKSGNTLLSTGNGHSVLEVTPEKEIVWSLHQNDLSGIRLAWVTTLEVLPSGNIVLGNCHAGPENPQLIEITRHKEVVWTYRDFDLFGNALSNAKVLE